MEHKYRVIREISTEVTVQEDGPGSLTNVGSKKYSKEIWNKTLPEEITIEYFGVKIVAFDKNSFTTFKLEKFDESLKEWKEIGNLRVKIDYQEEDEEDDIPDDDGEDYPWMR